MHTLDRVCLHCTELFIISFESRCKVKQKQSHVQQRSGPSALGSPLLVCEQLAPLQPRRDPVAMGQVVLGARGLQPADLGQHVKLLPGTCKTDRGGVSEVTHRCTGTSLTEHHLSVFILS